MINNQDLWQILAALRFWQSLYDEAMGFIDLTKKTLGHTHFDETAPMTIEEIDDLCIRLIRTSHIPRKQCFLANASPN